MKSFQENKKKVQDNNNEPEMTWTKMPQASGCCEFSYDETITVLENSKKVNDCHVVDLHFIAFIHHADVPIYSLSTNSLFT